MKYVASALGILLLSGVALAMLFNDSPGARQLRARLGFNTWKAEPAIEFAIGPGATEIFGARPGNQVRVHVAATSPVIVGFLPTAELEAVKDSSQLTGRKVMCLRERMKDVVIDCTLPPGEWGMFVADERTSASSALSGVVGVWTRDAGAMKSAIGDNTVRVELSYR